MSREALERLELLLLYLKIRLASGDEEGAQAVADEIARELKNNGKGEVSWDSSQE